MMIEEVSFRDHNKAHNL
jgi:hypothetical protein